MVTHVSFDMDGTLVSDDAESFLWHEEIPRLLATKQSISLIEARQQAYAAYYSAKYIEKVDRWTSLAYWLERFELSREQLSFDLWENVTIYSDVLPALDALRDKTLIVVTTAEREFLDLKLGPIRDRFARLYCTPEYGTSTKTEYVFEKICKDLGIAPSQLVHVGDRLDDLEAPQRIGARSFLLDREGKRAGPHVVPSLAAFSDRLRDLEYRT